MERLEGAISMLKYLFLGALMLGGCTTGWFYSKALLVDKRDDKLTLQYFVGEASTFYDSAFESKVNELCPQGYDVLERSYKPTTLTIWDEGYFYWVVKCRIK